MSFFLCQDLTLDIALAEFSQSPGVFLYLWLFSAYFCYLGTTEYSEQYSPGNMFSISHLEHARCFPRDEIHITDHAEET